MLHAAARQGTGALLPLTPACHRPAGTPTPTLPTVATECWDHSMSTGPSSHGFSLSPSPASLLFCSPALHLPRVFAPLLSCLDCKLLEGRACIYFFTFPLYRAGENSWTCLLKKSSLILRIVLITYIRNKLEIKTEQA